MRPGDDELERDNGERADEIARAIHTDLTRAATSSRSHLGRRQVMGILSLPSTGQNCAESVDLTNGREAVDQ